MNKRLCNAGDIIFCRRNYCLLVTAHSRSPLQYRCSTVEGYRMTLTSA
jgi:hypothetical protein